MFSRIFLKCEISEILEPDFSYFMNQHTSIDDSTLFERITQHDTEAFEIVMRRYTGALYAFAFRIIGDTLAAEDIVQEVFINLWEKDGN